MSASSLLRQACRQPCSIIFSGAGDVVSICWDGFLVDFPLELGVAVPL